MRGHRSDRREFTSWCTGRGLDPLPVDVGLRLQRVPPELYDTAPRLHAASRVHLLLTAPPAALPALARPWRYRDQRCFERHSPSLLRPLDRPWLVATDLDDDDTYLTGPRLFLDAVLADHRLEAQPQDTTPPS
jgi:hypothetical protein